MSSPAPVIYHSPTCVYSRELMELVYGGAGGGPGSYRIVDVTRQRPPAYVDRVPALVRDGYMYTDEPLFELFEQPSAVSAGDVPGSGEPGAPEAADDGLLSGGAFSGFFAPLDGVQDADVMRNECGPSGVTDPLVLDEAEPMPPRKD